MDNIINQIQDSFHISPDKVEGANNNIDWERLDFSAYTTSHAEAFKERFSKFPPEFYTALELAETEQNRLEVGTAIGAGHPGFQISVHFVNYSWALFLIRNCTAQIIRIWASFE